MPFCLDANVFIQAHRFYYAFDIAPSFWEGLLFHAENGNICSPIAVFHEISGDDELAQWVKEYRTILFEEPDDQINDIFAQIANYVSENYEPHQIAEFLDGADPWVIAHAKSKNYIVVTQEKLKVEERSPATGLISGKIKIPNICSVFDVQWINTFQLMRELNIRL